MLYINISPSNFSVLKVHLSIFSPVKTLHYIWCILLSLVVYIIIILSLDLQIRFIVPGGTF